MKVGQIHWQIALRKKRKELFKDIEAPFVAIPNPPGMWAADPFIFEKNETLYIFAELYPLSGKNGKIGYCVLEDGHFSKWNIVLEKSFHLSYPYIFQYKDNIFMMPESGAAGKICIYRAEKFPNQWIEELIITQDGAYVDSTFLNKNILITYNEPDRMLCYLKISPNREGSSLIQKVLDTTFHLRPAGKVINLNNKYIRPSQICEKYYGEALAFQEIDYIGEKYIEKEIFTITPNQLKIKGCNRKLCGVHTYNCTEKYEVIDIQYMKFSIKGFIYRVANKLSQIHNRFKTQFK